MKEVLRYLGVHEEAADGDLKGKILRLLPRFLKEISCKACWMEVPVTICGDRVQMDMIVADSANLAKNLMGCSRAILFAATIGSGADRMCRAASISLPSNAIILDAMGTAAIEWVCDALCKELSLKYPCDTLRPRYSPGYGDLSLDMQTELLRVLDAHRKIGLMLSESLMMIPQKSVTAIVGLRSDNI